MTKPTVRDLRRPSVLIATWFGTGLSPIAPGTAGSIAALPLAWALASWGGPIEILATACLVTFVGFFASRSMLADNGAEDPGYIVIDEVAGLLLPFAVLGPDPLHLATGFVLFRLFDILKPWPVSWFDRHVKGAAGVMLDDIAAGAYAMAVAYILVEFAGL